MAQKINSRTILAGGGGAIPGRSGGGRWAARSQAGEENWSAAGARWPEEEEAVREGVVAGGRGLAGEPSRRPGHGGARSPTGARKLGLDEV
jgi:hypothetical protein